MGMREESTVVEEGPRGAHGQSRDHHPECGSYSPEGFGFVQWNGISYRGIGKVGL